MNNPVVPKEQQSAYQRWEMASFGDDRPSAQRAAPAGGHDQFFQNPQNPPAQQGQPGGAQARDDAEIANLATQLAQRRDEAQRKGYEDGLREGYAKGLEQGREQAGEERLLLEDIASNFTGAVKDANERLAADMLRLALDIAKAMLKTALPVRPELVIPVINEAIRHLPTLQQPVLILNPIDAALIAGQLGDELAAAGWRVSEDPAMERAGCRVETATNQIDATTPVRWQRIAAALATDVNWLD
jgi:flagellar assembly protein FliH